MDGVLVYPQRAGAGLVQKVWHPPQLPPSAVFGVDRSRAITGRGGGGDASKATTAVERANPTSQSGLILLEMVIQNQYLRYLRR